MKSKKTFFILAFLTLNIFSTQQVLAYEVEHQSVERAAEVAIQNFLYARYQKFSKIIDKRILRISDTRLLRKLHRELRNPSIDDQKREKIIQIKEEILNGYGIDVKNRMIENVHQSIEKVIPKIAAGAARVGGLANYVVQLKAKYASIKNGRGPASDDDRPGYIGLSLIGLALVCMFISGQIVAVAASAAGAFVLTGLICLGAGTLCLLELID